MKRIRLLAFAVCLVMAVTLTAYAEAMPELHPKASEKKLINSDTAGWLQVPGTDIDDVIVQYTGDSNMYYFRHNFAKEYSFTGSYFADFRCAFENGKLSRNTVIYGHGMKTSQGDELFGQLDLYREKEFAEKNRLIYFATTDKTMAWQVFAVSVMDVSVPYNVPDLEDEKFEQALKQVRANSLYPYDEIKVGKQDKILTLSTGDYSVTGIYPNDYRFVIMAKLVDAPAVVNAEPLASANNSTTGR